MEGSSNPDLGCDEKTVLVTPHEEQMLLKSSLQPLNIDSSPSSNEDNSSVASVKEGCESPLSSWDSEPETDIPSVINCHEMLEKPLEGINLEENDLAVEEQNQFVGDEDTDDSLLWEMDNKSYDELLKKFNENEEELRVTNSKLQFSEEEIVKLKVQVWDSEGQLEFVKRELKVKEKELHKQREVSEEEIFKLKNQIKKSENQIDHVQEELKLKEEELENQAYELSLIPAHVENVYNLMAQLEVANEQLKISNDEISSLRKELESKSSETNQLQAQLKLAEKSIDKLECDQHISGSEQIEILKDLVTKYEADETNHKFEVRKMKAEKLDLQAQIAEFSVGKDQLHSEIASLLEMKMQLTSNLEDWKSRNIESENKLRQFVAEKIKQEKLYAAQQMILKDQINCFREELDKRKHDIEAANKEFHKQMIEIRDGTNAKFIKLMAEICSRDDRITNLKKYIHETETKGKEMVVQNYTTLNQVNKLKLRVTELEKEVTEQNAVISDRAEEKKEAIRQLCNSLEYYRSEYLELLHKIIQRHRRRNGPIVMSP